MQVLTSSSQLLSQHRSQNLLKSMSDHDTPLLKTLQCFPPHSEWKPKPWSPDPGLSKTWPSFCTRSLHSSRIPEPARLGPFRASALLPLPGKLIPQDTTWGVHSLSLLCSKVTFSVNSRKLSISQQNLKNEVLCLEKTILEDVFLLCYGRRWQLPGA